MSRRRAKPNYLDEVYADHNFSAEINADGTIDYVNAEGETRADVEAKVAERKTRLDGIGNVFQTADRIITREDIEVSVVYDKEMDSKATNDGRTIVLNAELIDELDSNTIAQAQGVNYHEVAHVLFSPRAGSVIGKHVKTNKMKRAFNMLEEARIERLITAKYPSTRLFLEANILEYALESDNYAELFTTFTGRRYLDIELRQRVANEFIKQHGLPLAQELSKIINDYSKLVYPDNFDDGIKLIERLTKIVGHDTDPMPSFPIPQEDMAHSKRDVMDKGRPRKGTEQQQLQDKIKDGEPEHFIEQQLTEGDGEGQGDTKQPSLGSQTDDVEKVEHANKEYSADDTKIANLLSERLANLHKDKRVKGEVNDTRKAILGNTEVRSVVKQARFTLNKPSMGAISYARKFALELERLVRDSDPKWHKDMPAGRLNISRTMTPDINAIGNVFDRWDTGSEATDIEAVILLDTSGSMSYHMRDVFEKAWIIKRGIEAIDGKVTIYNFDGNTELLYNSNEKAHPREYRYCFNGGWTNPKLGLLEAERILNASKKPIKMLFVVTDGEWDSPEQCDSVISRLNDNGVITSVVFMGNYDNVKNLIIKARTDMESAVSLKALAHGAKIFKAVTEPKHILELATSLVKSRIGK